MKLNEKPEKLFQKRILWELFGIKLRIAHNI